MFYPYVFGNYSSSNPSSQYVNTCARYNYPQNPHSHSAKVSSGSPLKHIPLYQATLRLRQIFRLRVAPGDGFEDEFTVGGISKTRERGIA